MRFDEPTIIHLKYTEIVPSAIRVNAEIAPFTYYSGEIVSRVYFLIYDVITLTSIVVTVKQHIVLLLYVLSVFMYRK